MAESKSDGASAHKATLGGLFSKPSQVDTSILVKKTQKREDIEVPDTTEEDKKKEEELEEKEREFTAQERKRRRKERKLKQKKEEENPDLESKYLSKLTSEADTNEETKPDKKETKAKDDVKETIKEAPKVNLKTQELEKAERTIFIGNVPTEVMQNKKSIKKFKKIFSEYVKGDPNIARQPIQSIRFRSIHKNSSAPRKAAYIKQEVEEGGIMNSYIVFKKAEDSMKATDLNATVYLGHHLRVDHLTHPRTHENKLCVFIGNLGFEEDEECIWKYFDDKFKDAKAADSLDKPIVTNVRLVRDSKTNFGKGFAVVQFSDVNYVEKALLLNGQKLTTAKKPRSMRIARCKSIKRDITRGDKRKKRARDHFDENLTERQKTSIGRARKVLGKRDRWEAGMPVLEGQRARKDQKIEGMNKRKKRKMGKKRKGGKNSRKH